jgi:hypothetical protein
MYTSDRREAGGSGWSTDYWDADINFSTRLGELTKTTISRQANGDPNHFTIRISDPALFQCPILSATEVGTALFTGRSRRRRCAPISRRAASCGSTTSGARTRGTTG